MLRVQQHPVPHSQLHVPPGGVERRLAPLLPRLQQRPHLLRHAPHESAQRVLAWNRGVMGHGGGKRAAGVMAAVGVERRVATSEGRRWVADRGLDRRRQGRPGVGTLAGEGTRDAGGDAVDAFYLAGAVMMMWRAVDAQILLHRRRHWPGKPRDHTERRSRASCHGQRAHPA